MGQARYHWAIRRVVSKEESVRLSLERNKLKVVLLEGIHPSAVKTLAQPSHSRRALPEVQVVLARIRPHVLSHDF